ncbi:serine protease [Streptomyces sp. ATCC 21386]|uniref:S1 family peptidase n=1 Tax=Streptomyces sp. ATCC 21386 TaxID=2699428 RepID=UPI001BFEEE8B|nr:serine protease [Streptomyces sp. ATCC 21386]
MSERAAGADPRVVELASLRAGAKAHTAGSGYLLHDGLVITAAHTVPPPGTGGVRVRPGGTGPWLPARVLLRRYREPAAPEGQEPRGAQDFAVLRVEDESGLPTELPPVRWGRLAGRPCSARIEATGFPAGLKVYEDRGGPRLSTVLRDTAHISGTIVSSDGHSSRHVVHVVHPVPSPPDGAAGTSGKRRTRWDGMSGSAVLCEGMLVGVVVRADTLAGVEIEETAALWDDPEARALLGLRGLRPRPAELSRVLHRPTARPALSPISLLRPEAAAVRFHGRETTLRDLADWRNSAADASVRLLTGPGGQGKTRVGLEAVREAERAGWTAGFLADRADPRALSGLSALDTPLLLVVDYAETRRSQLDELLDVLGPSGPAHQRHPVRLLFLARKAGPWWSRLQAHEHFPRDAGVSPLPPLEPTAALRAVAVSDAMAGLGERLAALYPGQSARKAMRAAVPPSVAEDRYSGALNLQMAVLVALLQAVDPVRVTSGERDEAVLLRHEQKVWWRTAGSHGIGGLSLFEYRRMVAAATLCPADDEQQALDILSRLRPKGPTREPAAPPPDSAACGRWLSGLYPSEDDYWGPLQPDRLGEYLLGDVLAEDPELLGRLLPTTTERQTSAAFHLLSRAQPHQPHISEPLRIVVTAHPDPLALRAVDAVVAVENPAALRQALAAVLEKIRGAAGRYASLAERLYEAVPLPSLALDEWAADLAGLLARQPPNATTTDPHEASAEHARRLHRHAVRLVEIGQLTAARTAAEKSVALWHVLAAHGWPGAESGLGLALNTLALASDHGRSRPKALSLSQDVLRHYQELAERDPDTYTADLAMAWYNHANRLADADRLDDALRGALTARDLYRDLAHDDPEHLPDVALAEYGLTRIHSALGQFGAATADARRAADLYRDLAARWPDRYRPRVPEVVGSLAELLRTAGLFTEALEVAEESLTEFRRLAALDPKRFAQDLAEGLSDATAVFDDHGDEERARAAAEEAVELLRPLAEADANVAPSFANALIALSHHVPEQSIDLRREAVAIYERAEAAAPGVHGSAPAVVRSALGEALTDAGHYPEGLRAFDESIAALRPYADRLPAAHGPELANALDLQSYALFDAGDPEGALRTATEAFEVFAVAVAEEPGAFLDEFARVSGNLVFHLARRDRWSEILTLTGRALALCGLPAAEGLPRRFDAVLELLNHRSLALGELGRHEEAADCVRDMVALRRRIVDADPDDVGHRLALAGDLSRLSDTLAEAGRPCDAVAPVREALALRRGVSADVDAYADSEEDADADSEEDGDEGADGDDESEDGAAEGGTAVEGEAEIDEEVSEGALLVQLAAALQRAGDTGAPAAAVEALRHHEDPAGLPMQGREDGYCQALHLYAAAQSAAGHFEAAVDACQHLVVLRAQETAGAAASGLEGSRLDLDEALTSLAWALLDAGSWPRALSLSRGVLRSLTAPEARPADTTPQHRVALGGALHVLALALTAAGHHREAVRTARRALAVRRRLAARFPGTHMPELAETMGVLALTLHAAGLATEATTVIRRAVALGTRLATTAPAAHRDGLRQLLRHQARIESPPPRNRSAGADSTGTCPKAAGEGPENALE